MKSQLRLNLTRSPVYRRRDFVVSPANAATVEIVHAWRTWPGGVLALVGPEGSGKTHLASIWAEEANAVILRHPLADLGPLRGKAALIEDADQWPDPESLFHLLNVTLDGGSLLLTSRLRPAEWPAPLADLRSRFNAMTAAELGEPDDAVLGGVIRLLFEERNIRPADDLLPYLLKRIERSVPAAREVVMALDEASAAQRREVNRALAVQILEVDSVMKDLFDR